MGSLGTKLAWRAELVGKKLTGTLPEIPWRVLGRTILEEHASCSTSVSVLERDDAAGMVLLGIGKHQFWYPAEASTTILPFVYEEVFDPRNGHHYEYAGARLRPNDVALDAGACEGFFVRYALERQARVLAVEPWSRMAGCLERTFASEVADGRVQIVQALLGPEPGSSQLSVDPEHPFKAASTFGTSDPHTETVPVQRMDEVVVESSFGRVDFIKMDIEGAELSALAGGTEAIREFRPRLSITTYHQLDHWHRIPALIRSACADYLFDHKGMINYEGGGWRPIMVHAWPAGAGA
jgi:FkbM family methyltransferase